jgi:hypothetical protein
VTAQWRYLTLESLDFRTQTPRKRTSLGRFYKSRAIPVDLRQDLTNERIVPSVLITRLPMFSPKRLGSLGLGSDPKLAFRTQPGGIAKLAEKKEIAETDDAYWAQVFLPVLRIPFHSRLHDVHVVCTVI